LLMKIKKAAGLVILRMILNTWKETHSRLNRIQDLEVGHVEA